MNFNTEPKETTPTKDTTKLPTTEYTGPPIFSSKYSNIIKKNYSSLEDRTHTG